MNLIAAGHLSRGFGPRGGVRAVDDANLVIAPGETVALVGESGSGKSTLGRMLLGLLRPDAGTVSWRGTPIGALRGEAWARYRAETQAVFQDSGASLNPRRTVAESIALPLRWNRGLRRGAVAREVDALLDQVGLAPAAFRDRLPHALSGGQRQRVGIARALASEPTLVVADEPVSALDVSVRAQILRLLATLRRERGLACLFITHDLGAARAIAHRVLVMRQGRIVEQGSVAEIFAAPRHPYTRALLAATPVADPGGISFR